MKTDNDEDSADGFCEQRLILIRLSGVFWCALAAIVGDGGINEASVLGSMMTRPLWVVWLEVSAYELMVFRRIRRFLKVDVDSVETFDLVRIRRSQLISGVIVGVDDEVLFELM